MDLRARLSTLIAIRLVVSTVLLGSAIAVQVNSPGAFPVNPFFFLIGLAYALSVIYLGAVRFVGRRPWLIDLQLSGDALIISAFVYVTGGITSYFSSLYLLAIIAASRFRSRRSALRLATLSALLYLLLVGLQYLHALGYLQGLWLNETRSDLPSGWLAQYTIGINLFGFYAVALLSGSLAEGMRSAGVSLARASTQIADLRAFNAYLIDNLLSGLATTDQAGDILTFNRAGATITGIAVEVAIGHDVVDVLQLPVDFPSMLEKAQNGARGVRLDYEYLVPGRTTIDLGLTVSALAFPDGARGFLFTFQDITEVKRLERHGHAQQRLAAAGEMAAGIAHEIRNPLASMSGSIQVLRQELHLTEEQAQLMDIVLRESERLNETIRSFLAYARPQRFAFKRLDLRTTLKDTALLIRNGSDVKDGHVVEVDAPTTPVWYEADENQIRQIVWNLATNGLRAMAAGGRLRLAVSTDTAANEVVLVVEDQGRGIPADQLERVFEPFRSSFEKGTGLGLAIVHRIVTDYTGTIQISSTVGVGTAVRVRLPVRKSAAEALPAAVTQVSAAGGAAL
jgi:two-component system sensor histidine kinase PilS (NtrC family)